MVKLILEVAKKAILMVQFIFYPTDQFYHQDGIPKQLFGVISQRVKQ